MNTIICDNAPAYAECCQQHLALLARKHNIPVQVEIIESGKRLLFEDELLSQADLIIIEEHLPDMCGMDAALELRRRSIRADIVFYTTDESRAIDAYDVEALHYMLKDVTPESKLESIFLKAEARAKRRHAHVLSLSCAGEHRNIDIASILYFEVKKRIITVHYMGAGEKESFDFYSSLSRIEELLFGKGFVRIHRAYLVGKNHVRRVAKEEVEMASGDVLPLGSTYQRGGDLWG